MEPHFQRYNDVSESGKPSRTRPDAKHGVEGDSLVEVAVLDGDGDDDAGHEHHGGLLHVLPPHRVRGHHACNQTDLFGSSLH